MSGLQSVQSVALTLCLLMSLGWSALVLAVSAAITRSIPAERGRHAIWWTALVLCVLPLAASPLIFFMPFNAAVPEIEGGAFTVLLDGGAVAAGVSAPEVWGWMEAASPWVTIIYGAGVVWHAGLLARGHMRLARLLAECRPVRDIRLVRPLQRWRERLGLMRLPRLRSTALEISPFLFGWRKPVLVLPDSLLQGHARDTAVLSCAHELAHLRRGDTWFVSVQRIMSVLVWFNPFARLIIRRLESSREVACDALILERAAHERHAYARALLTVLRLASRKPERAAALGVSLIQSGRKEHEMRLKAILTYRSVGSAPARTLICCALLLVTLGPAAAVQVALAKDTAQSASVQLSSSGSKPPLDERPLRSTASVDTACKDDPVPVSRAFPDHPFPGAEAKVLLSFTVTADGRTKDIKIVKSTDSRFDEAAANAVKKWRYAPCANGVSSKGVRVEIKFKRHQPEN